MASELDIADLVKSVVAGAVKRASVDEGDSFDELGVSSLSFIQVLIEIEAKLGAMLDVEEIEGRSMDAVGDLIAWVRGDGRI
jgi:acyl carrier protein